MREVVLDTETIGLNPSTGDRIVEIGCVELVNHMATGESFHQYVNPQRPMPDEAFRVHGLSDEFLADQPAMSNVYHARAVRRTSRRRPATPCTGRRQ